MKKIVIFILLALLLLITIFLSYFWWKRTFINCIDGCCPPINTSGNLILRVFTNPWVGGDSPNTQTNPESKDYSVLAGTTITLNDPISKENYLLTVKEANTEKAVVTVKGLDLNQGKDLDSGINLLEGCRNKLGFPVERTITIKKDEIIELNTCTMDAGTEWTITYTEPIVNALPD